MSLDLRLKESLRTDDEVLDYTQRLRQELLTTIAGGGIPADTKVQTLLAAILTDMDRTALAKLKIGSKEKQSNADREAALIAAKLASTYGGRSPFESTNPAVENSSTDRILDDSGMPPLTLSPGETDVGISSRTYNDFMNAVEGVVVDTPPPLDDSGE